VVPGLLLMIVLISASSLVLPPKSFIISGFPFTDFYLKDMKKQQLTLGFF
jgi:hypothetical protein